jgi:MinD superfamily P-loop ATPase
VAVERVVDLVVDEVGVKSLNMSKLQKIAITGGKGGTGKTTFAVLLANKLVKQGKRVFLVDCDVECPNGHLLLGKKLASPKGAVYAKFPVLNESRCKKCGQCVIACQSKAIFQPPGKYPIFLSELCSSCGACWLTCPNQAIRIKKVKTGQIFGDKIKNNFWLITGLAEPGLEETGPVVRQVKDFALKSAEKNQADVILFDTAAGIHCPVIAALLNVDFAYVVTEPTPMGACDLSLILDLCQKLQAPTKIVINQADLGDQKIIQKVLKQFKIKKAEKEIPYSRELAAAYSKGRLRDWNRIFSGF